MQDDLNLMAAASGDMWKQQALEGDLMEGFRLSPHYQVLEDLILKKIESGALTLLKNPNLDLTDLNQLYQARALAQSADLIRKKIDEKIQQGYNARTYLKQMNSTQPKEGEL